jgi:hypothetical protein
VLPLRLPYPFAPESPALAQGSATLSSTYAIRSAGFATRSGTYAVRAAGSASRSSTYAIRQAGFAALSGAYAIGAAMSAGSSALAGTYAIRAAGSATRTSSYAIRGAQWAALSSAFAIRAAGSAVLPSTYQIAGDGSGATAGQIWSYVLSNGKTAGQTLVEAHAWLSELHLIHGLRAGSPLQVTETARVAGHIAQALREAQGTVTVERQP